MNSTNDQELILFNLNFISTIILTAICLIGNTTVIYIFLKPEFQKVPMFNYLIASTVASTLNLLANWPTVYRDQFFIDKLSISCKMFYFFFYVPFQMTPWLLTLSSLDRYLSVKYPTSLRFRNKIKYQYLAIMLLTISICFINIPIVIYHDIGAKSGCSTTSFAVQFKLDIFNLLFATLIPFVLMIFTTSLIWIELVKKRAKIGKEKREKLKYRKEVKLIKILCIMDLYFLACNLPYVTLVVINDAQGVDSLNSIGLYIADIFAYIFSSCDCFIYFFFNRLFRKHVLSIIHLTHKHFENRLLELGNISMSKRSNLSIRLSQLRQ